MQTITYKISQDIFSKEPNFRRAVLVFSNVVNKETPEEVWALFKQTVAAVKQIVTSETITVQPQIAAWRSVFKNMGVNPTNDKPAIEALLRRVVNNPEGEFKKGIPCAKKIAWQYPNTRRCGKGTWC